MPTAEFPAVGTPLRVLAIDDNPADLELLAVAFEAIAVPVDLHTATDGRDAVDQMQSELLREGGWRPDLMLIDLSMPRIDGLETIARLRGNRALAKVPLAVLSGSHNPADRSRAIAAGAGCFLTKAADFDGLMDLLRDLIAQLPTLRRNVQRGRAHG